MSKPHFGCGRKECGASTSTAGTMTFGTGGLDEHGFWEHPCAECERAWEKELSEVQKWVEDQVDGSF